MVKIVLKLFMESIKIFFIGLYLAKLNDAIYDGHTFVCFMMLFGDVK